MREFSFSEVLELTTATRSQCIHLMARHVITTDLWKSQGTGHPRRFSFFNLIEFEIGAGFGAVGVEHYALAQVLRKIRWVIGDPKGFETWWETFSQSKGARRQRFDTRLLAIENWAITEFGIWLFDDQDDDAEENRAREYVRARVRELAQQSS